MDKQYIASISYGKDSLAMLEAIKILGYPLDRIITAEVWATDTIPADLPPMQNFKAKADEIILDRYGIQVEHFDAGLTFEQGFYHPIRPETIARRKQNGKHISKYQQYDEERAIWGFPTLKGSWCNSKLKMSAVKIANKSCVDATSYVGIACDEPERIERHKVKPNVSMPLVDIGWDEPYCRQWCEENDLLSPIYKDSARGGCWFCHNQGIGQLRKLRKSYPEYWKLLLKWDLDSPVTFKADGHTVHDFEERFREEDEGLIPTNAPFRWSMVGCKEPYQLEMRW